MLAVVTTAGKAILTFRLKSCNIINCSSTSNPKFKQHTELELVTAYYLLPPPLEGVDDLLFYVTALH